ncbi:MAG: response regulator [Chloroflexota bacterium]|nr:response regulator [Chloroflexota bacterium]
MTAPMIAVLDNDPSFLSLMHALLTDEGYRTLRCRPDDVVSAHALVKRARPALVILDLWLAKREDGWAFLTRLWDDRETARIPALIVTGEPVVLPEHAAVLHAKHCPIVRKPFDWQDLLTAVATILDVPHQPTVTAFPADPEGRPYCPEYAVFTNHIARLGSAESDRTA